MRTLLAIVLLSATVYAQETEDKPVDPELAACKAQVQKLANDVVTARLEALVKLEEYRKYEEARKQREALKKP